MTSLAASGAMTTSTSATYQRSCLENNFGLSIENDYRNTVASNPNGVYVGTRAQGTWKNPYMKSAITPYLPSGNDEKCIKTWETTIKQQSSLAFLSPQHLFFSNIDIIVIILSKLDLKNVLNSSKACKCFYLASKNDLIWRKQIYNLLPRVNVIVTEDCSFSPEQQFKIIYKRINNEKKRFVVRFDYKQAQSLKLITSIEKDKVIYEAAGGEDAYNQIDQKINQQFAVDDYDTDDLESSPVFIHGNIYRGNMFILKEMNGESYDGTIESIDKGSEQGKLLNVINVRIKNVFNKQDKFVKVIQESETLKNTSSSNSNLVVEDVTNSSNKS